MSDEEETVDTETCISEAIQHLYIRTPDIVTTECSPDGMEHEVVRQFMYKARGMQCCEQFSPKMLDEQRRPALSQHILNLKRQSLGNWLQLRNTSSTLSAGMLSAGRAHHTKTERERLYTSYFSQGKPVCQKMFRILHGMGKSA